MTVPGPSARWLLVDGYDLGSSGYMGEFVPASIEEGVDELTSPFATAPIILPTGFSKGGDVKVPLWADSTLQAVLDSWQGTTPATRVAQRVICYGWTGAQAAPTAHVAVKFEGAVGYLAKVEPKIPSEKLSLAEATFKIGNMRYGVEIGDILKPLAAVTADGNSEATYVDGGATAAPSTAGGAGYIQCTALTLDGATNLACTVEDSADHVTYGALATFTVITAAPAKERKAVTGDVERYVAATWVWTGGAGAGSTATVFIGFARF